MAVLQLSLLATEKAKGLNSRINGQLLRRELWICGFTEVKLDEAWLAKYNEVKNFIETNKRNPSKFIPEERGRYLNWIKHNRKLYGAGLLKEDEDRVEKFKELLALMEEYKRVNQWE